MLAVFMCYIMLQLVLHDGIKRAQEESEDSPRGRVVSLDVGKKAPGHRAG